MAKRGRLTRVGRALKLALAFLTIVPVRIGDDEATDDDLAASRFAYPIVGAAIGLLLAALSAGLARIGAAPGIAAFVIAATSAILTGGLHLDGLADTADGLFLWGDRDRRLTVMRDPHVGSYGIAAVVLVILGKYAVLSILSDPQRGRGILVAAVVARALILVSAGMARYARSEGTGRIVIEATTLRDAIGAAALALAVGWAGGGRVGVLAASLAIVLAWGLTRVAVARLGGVTGDTLGALVELGELVVLLTLGLVGPPAP